MRKLLCALLLAIISMSMNAQTVGYKGAIDEYLLQGGWRIESSTGSIEALKGVPTFFTMGVYGGNLYDVADSVRIDSWFISNGNKLHWRLTNGFDVYFIIMDYNSDERTMELKTFDDQCIMKVYQWRPEVSSIPAKKVSKSNKGKKYDIGGIETSNPHGVYIQDGYKYLTK